MKKEYDGFVQDVAIFQKGEQEVAITIRELTPDKGKEKYGSVYVKALISPGKGKGDILHLRDLRGISSPGEFSVKIIENLGEFQQKEREVRT